MVDASKIKQLREATGAGILDCKKALTENAGDFDQAIDWLRKKGIASASKKSGRVASDGLIGLLTSDSRAAIIEVNSETDFVAKSEKFQQLVLNVLDLALSSSSDSLDALLKQSFANGKTVPEAVVEAISTIGENLIIRRVASLSADKGFVASYIHNAVSDKLGKIGVLISINSSKKSEATENFTRQLAMHIAASKPVAVSPSEVSDDLISKEKEIFTDQARASGKPDNIIEKMVEGRIRKYYEEVAFLEQAFVIDGKTKVKDAIAAFNKENDCDLSINSFVRFELGEGIEKEEQDFAAEVNSIVKSS